MATLTVGPGQQFETIESAVAAANPGDTIDVQAGTYNDDFLGIYQDLTLQSVGGAVVMTEDTSPDNGKAMIDEGGPGVNVTIDGFDISGVSVGDGNGAAIRYEGGNLTLNQDYFHNNQEGLLAASDPNGTITINDSEFADNGDGSGSTHNIYVNNIATLTVENSYIHDAVVGHDIKSRADDTIITNDRIFDLNNGAGEGASYEIDLPNGGDATITGNTIEKGPKAQNPYMIAYGEEGQSNPGTSVNVSNNTIVNDDASPNDAVFLSRTGTAPTFDNNQVWGLSPSQLTAGGGPLDEAGTTFLTIRPTLDTASTWDNGLVCFLAGTRIATPAGDVKVEALAVGDVVRTVGGQNRIVWIGTGRVLATRGRRSAATPVTVRKGALADNVPHSDLRVTKGHALYIDGALIPVEFLINHRSIMWDDQAQEVALYHIELETHDVILANGAPAESYRDDGNRWLFRNANSGWHLLPQEPCAPVLTGGPLVDAIWWRLLARTGPRPGFPLTDDPDLHLLVDGQRVDATVVANRHYVFRLPTSPREVRIVSRASVPSELGLSRDPRPLGIAVRSVAILDGPLSRRVEAADAALQDGFHDYEPNEGIRWTAGNALVPTDVFRGITDPVDVEIVTTGATRYLDEGVSLAA
jgi:hypothetical protein